MPINHDLRSARRAKRWSMQVASERVGVDRVTYSRWERGEQTPHLSTLDLLCRAFEQSPEALGFAHLVGTPARWEADTGGARQGRLIPFPVGRLPRRPRSEEGYA